MGLLQNKTLPPPPNPDDDINGYSWRDWFKQLRDYVVSGSSVLWSQLDFTGSKITDIQSRQHNSLQLVQGGTTDEKYHLTASEYTGTGTGDFVRENSPTITNASITGALTGTTTNIAGGATNRIVYQTAANTTGFIAAPSVSNTYLLWNGSAFTWGGGGSGGGGTVTSVDMTVPTGLSVSGNPITSSGTLAISYASGYSIPTTASQTNWNTAYTDRYKWDGSSSGLTASTGRTSLGATTVGSNLFTLTNPSAITFPRFNADNTVSTLDAVDFRTAIGAGTGNGSVTSVSGAGTVSGLSLLGTVTTSGSITLTGTLSVVPSNFSSQTANTVLAAPDGSSGTPTFRALTQNDIPKSTPATKTADFTVAATEQYLVVNKTGSSCVVTLPSASTNAGRMLYFINRQDQAVVSNSSNVVPREGGSAITSILPAVAGNWSMLVSDGTNWLMIANSFANCS